MFKAGETVVCGSKGVCRVEKVATLDISGVEKEREYYILKPLYMMASTVYVPVDTAQSSLRRILTADEAHQLIGRMPEIPLIAISNEKLLEQEYKNCLKTNQCEEWVKVIKTVRERKQKRQEVGRKVTAIDAKYLKIAQDYLFGELAAALAMPKESVEEYIANRLDVDICV